MLGHNTFLRLSQLGEHQLRHRSEAATRAFSGLRTSSLEGATLAPLACSDALPSRDFLLNAEIGIPQATVAR